MAPETSDLDDEPQYRSPPLPAEPDDHEVWDEPALMPGARPDDPERTRSAFLRNRWNTARPAPSWALTLALAVATGPLAILCALFKSSSWVAISALAILGPLVEEMGKALAPLMVLERSPYRFTAGWQPLLVCAIGGFVFAQIENALYFHAYLDSPAPLLVQWRQTVCVALHVGCSAIAGLGLRRTWRAAHAARGRADIRLAAPYLVAAIVLHGAYNAAVFLLETSGTLEF